MGEKINIKMNEEKLKRKGKSRMEAPFSDIISNA
jgi:hypothetical protein